MNVIIKEVKTEDWQAIYINDALVDEGHFVNIAEICDEIQSFIDKNGSIDSIKGEYYCLDDCEYGFPNDFNEIPKDGLWLMGSVRGV